MYTRNPRALGTQGALAGLGSRGDGHGNHTLGTVS
jgi:hypothetical protein